MFIMDAQGVKSIWQLNLQNGIIQSDIMCTCLYLPTFPKSNASDFHIHITQIPEKFATTFDYY